GQPVRSAFERGTRAPDVPVAVGVRLDDSAQPRAVREQRLQVRAVALHGSEVDAGHRPLRLAHGIASGIASITSPAITWFAPSRRAATLPARACASTPAAAASSGCMPLASRAPVSPDRTSPVPAVASAGVAPGLTAAVPSGVATIESSPFSTTMQPLR